MQKIAERSYGNKKGICDKHFLRYFWSWGKLICSPLFMFSCILNECKSHNHLFTFQYDIGSCQLVKLKCFVCSTRYTKRFKWTLYSTEYVSEHRAKSNKPRSCCCCSSFPSIVFWKIDYWIWYWRYWWKSMNLLVILNWFH